MSIGHVARQVNKCAHKLANIAIEKEERLLVIINIPDEIKHIVDFEGMVPIEIGKWFSTEKQRIYHNYILSTVEM